MTETEIRVTKPLIIPDAFQGTEKLRAVDRSFQQSCCQQLVGCCECHTAWKLIPLKQELPVSYVSDNEKQDDSTVLSVGAVGTTDKLAALVEKLVESGETGKHRSKTDSGRMY